MELRIDPEFESRVPPLSKDEFENLEETILADGEILQPIITWNDTVIDGHNRYRILLKHPGIPCKFISRDFEDRYDAMAWICKNQLNRRNLTVLQKKYLLGKQYEAEKASHGGDRKSEEEKSSGQNVHLIEHQKTAERIARENNTNEKFIRRAEAFAKGLDLAEDTSPGIRDEILSGQIKPTQEEVSHLVKASSEKLPELIGQLRVPRNDRPPPKAAPEGSSDSFGELLRDVINEIDSADYASGTAADLFTELEDAFSTMTFRWNWGLRQYKLLLKAPAAKKQLKQTIRECESFLKSVKEDFLH